jgi:YD repeat-containing protein
VKRVVYPGGLVVEYAYDESDLIIEVGTSRGLRVGFKNDADGQPTEVNLSKRLRLEMEYQDGGSLTGFSYKLSGKDFV